MTLSMLPIIRPDITFEEVEDGLRSVLASGRLTSGPWTERFEHDVASVVGVDHAIATTSATTALHLTLAALGVGPGDEVLVSDFTFPATGNVVVQLGARPVLVDTLPGSFRIDPAAAAAEVTSRTVAILPVDPFGQPADLLHLEALAMRHGLALVEDAACALGASIAGRACGAWPTAGCFSFHPRKVVTTGEGGMITTDDAELATRLRRLRSHGAAPAPSAVGMAFAEHGFNYRMGELAAVLGVAQLARVDEILADRRATAQLYDHLLDGVPGVLVPQEGWGERWAYQSYVVVLEDDIRRDDVVGSLAARGIESTLGTYAMHAQPAFAAYGYRPGDLPRSCRMQAQTLTLPLLSRMPRGTVEYVVEALGLAMEEQA